MKKGHLAAIFTIFVWGTTYISTKILLKTFNPTEILLTRFIIGTAVLFLFSPSLIKWQGWKTEGILALCGISGISLYYMLENVSLIYTSAANCGVIIALAPFFTALLLWILEKNKSAFSRNFVIGFILSISGVAILSFQGQKFGFNPLGDLIALGAPVCWAVYSLTSRHLANIKLSLLASTRRIFEYGIIFLLPMLLFSEFSIKASDFTAENLLHLAYLSFIASALCFYTWNFATKTLGALKTGIYIYLTPVVTLVFSAIILHEGVTVLSITGAILALSGLVISERGVKKT
ncbi:MAG: DMT family transporter [Spirochaetales bacterium]|nr:DMT family transporter [Spirochaetales bacterium]